MSHLLLIQTNVVGILNGDAFFNDPDATRRIVVVGQSNGDVETEVTTKIANLGISVVVVMPLLKLPDPEVPALEVRVPLVVEVVENVTLNQGMSGTRKSVLEVCENIVCLLHGAGTGIGNPRVNSNRIMGTQDVITMVDTTPTYHCNFTAPLTLTPRRAHAAPGTP